MEVQVVFNGDVQVFDRMPCGTTVYAGEVSEP